MNRVVITGIGALTPVGNDIKTFWENLVKGVNGIDNISYFDTSPFKNKLAAELKGFKPEDCLDKNFVRKNDAYTLYALAAAQEAMADSGLEGKIAGEDIGVYFGSGIGGFKTFCTEHEALLTGGARKVSPLFIPKMISNIAAGNIAIRFGARGPCFSVTTACASSSSCIGEAYRAIKHGYAKAMISGGSEAPIIPLAIAGFGNALALSPSQDKNAASLPFDKRRDGFVIGEGAGALILEEYEHALRRGAKIYAEICGYGSTCDAYHVTAPDPEAKATAKAISDSLAGLEFDASKTYVNAHGTGTKLNDKTETAAIRNAFGEDKAKLLHISSTKSMTGHMLGAAGAVEAIAAVLALKNGVIPPTINYLVPDEECDLDYTPNKAAKVDLELALSTSFGFGGHNACLAFRKV